MSEEIEVYREFPALGQVCRTSDSTWSYNCHAWAMDETSVWWEPTDPNAPWIPSWVRVYWPRPLPVSDFSLGNFQAAFRTRHYAPCSDGLLEAGFDKVALYAQRRAVTHTARQLPSGAWTSKCGPNIDIHHPDPTVLEGPTYGSVAAFMRRRRQSPE